VPSKQSDLVVYPYRRKRKEKELGHETGEEGVKFVHYQ